jgi:ABC-type dipeptide/oligopeptide/nickel transport system permease subunit
LSYAAQFQAPDGAHWLGTDVHGRDLLTRVLFGARVSLMVGVVGAGVALGIGVAWGAVAGYVGGRLDSLMMRAVDVLYSLPSIIFVMVLITTLNQSAQAALARLRAPWGPGLAEAAPLFFLFVGLGRCPGADHGAHRARPGARRARAFVEPAALWAHPMGASSGGISCPMLGIVIVYLTLTVPAVILYESFLSYLGLGIQPPDGQLGLARGGWRRPTQPDPDLLVADRLPGSPSSRLCSP